MLYSKLVEAILYIRRLIPEAFITLNTNGILLTQIYAKKILDANIDSIAVSIDGNNKEEYERIRVGLKWDSGDVTRCDYDWEGEVVVGNIKNKTILELWTKSELSAIRLKHLFGLKRKLDLCDNCSYRMNDVFKKSNLTIRS